MIDLQPYFDSARAAEDEVQRIMNEMNSAFADGTEEGKQKALDLRPALDEAQKKANDAQTLYISMRNAAATTDNPAQNFVPASENAVESPAGKKMDRAAFSAMNAAARMKFIHDGGEVVDPE